VQLRVLACVLGLVFVSSAFSDPTNGGFESGDLSGWSSSGFVNAVEFENSRDFLDPTHGDWLPTEGKWFASLWSTDSGRVSSSSLWQKFDSKAGYVLKFDYFFDFGDFAPLYDTATATLVLPDATEVSLFEHNLPGSELADDEEVGWKTITYQLTQTGEYTLKFQTTDYGTEFESILGVDNVRAIVPEPASLFVLALGGAALLRRRTRS
jgi:hypothetical protein